MLCSTVIPTVNRPSLERALKSAVAQGLGPDEHEIIVVNDSGSPLPDFEWLRLPQIQIVNTNRCNRSAACNTGAAVATGKYLKILHDDDYLLPGALCELIRVAETTGADWVYGALNRVDDDDELISVNAPVVHGNLFGHTVAGDSLHLSASLIRREAFFEVGCFNVGLSTAEDLDLLSRISSNGTVMYTTSVVAGVRVGNWGNTTTQWNRSTLECRSIREGALDTLHARARITDSVKGDITLRGRCCRAYGISALLNFRAGRVLTGISRLVAVVPLTSYHILQPAFWQGLTLRSYWHKYEMAREYEHHRTHYPDRQITPQAW